jgi:hypothetical protein
VLCFIGAAVCVAQDVQMGTWKLNEAKSKLAPGGPKNSAVVVEAAGDNVKVTVDGVGSDGKPTHNEWTGKFDGKDYPVTGDPTSDKRSYMKIDDRTLGLNVKKGGKTNLAIIFHPSRIIQSYGMSVKCISVRFRSFRLRVKQSELFDGHRVNGRLSLFCNRHTQQRGYKGTRMGTRRIAE